MEHAMSLYQCERCGCRENTALAMQPKMPTRWFDWTGIEDRRGKHLCSVCMPTRYADGSPTDGGVWHGEFERVYLPLGEFHTNDRGNLQHTATGRTGVKAFELK
jgi:hypothetical protein